MRRQPGALRRQHPPASGAWSDVTDLAAYAATQLHGIAPDGERVVSEENLAETHAEAVAEGNGGELRHGLARPRWLLRLKALIENENLGLVRVATTNGIRDEPLP
jgi:hypothetical protein